MRDEWQQVRDELLSAGVAGVEDLGRFVNNTTYFAPSTFDGQAAAPTLLRLLPALTDARVVSTVGRHLQAPWLRQLDGAYETVRVAYVKWAPQPIETGWVLGDTLCKAADRFRGADLLALAQHDVDGQSRGCIVEALWRFKSTVAVEQALRRLIHDPTVVVPALSSLQRTVGAEAMLPILTTLLAEDDDPAVQTAARRQLSRVRRKIG